MIRQVRYDSVVAQALIADALADLGARYGGPGMDSGRPGGVRAAARAWSPTSTATGRLRRLAHVRRRSDRGRVEADTPPPGASARSGPTGVSRSGGVGALYGRHRMILECGQRQRGVSLYLAAGYHRIPDFGYYRGHQRWCRWVGICDPTHRPPDCPSGGASDLAGLQAGGAHPQSTGVPTPGRGAHRLDVRDPAAPGPSVRVGHVVAKAGLLAADVTHAGHGSLLPSLGLRAAREAAGNPDSLAAPSGRPMMAGGLPPRPRGRYRPSGDTRRIFRIR